MDEPNYDEILAAVLAELPPFDPVTLRSYPVDEHHWFDYFHELTFALKREYNLETVEAYDIVRDFVARHSLPILVPSYVGPDFKLDNPSDGKPWWRFW